MLVVRVLVGLLKPQTEATLYLQPLLPLVVEVAVEMVTVRNKPKMAVLGVAVVVALQLPGG